MRRKYEKVYSGRDWLEMFAGINYFYILFCILIMYLYLFVFNVFIIMLMPL